MKALDLCCGAGGLSLGLTRAGFDVLGIDADADALDTHRRHVGPCEAGDLRTYYPPHWFDLVAGGIPCQPFSSAGKGLALEDDRYLLPDFLRIAREAHARAVLIENVRGLVQKPRAFRTVLDAVAAEYLVTWTVLDAADYGVPQHRDRLFIVGFRDLAALARFRWPLATHAPRGDIFGRPPYRTVREALRLGGAAFRAELSGSSGVDLLDRPSPAVTVATNVYGDDGTRRRMTAALDAALDRPAPCVTATEQKSAMRGTQPMRRQREELAAELEAAGLADRPATTVQADPRLAVAGHHDRQQNGAVRLTPEQCAILQDFPPGWTWTGNKSSQHRQIGNAVPPGLAEAVGRAVRSALG